MKTRSKQKLIPIESLSQMIQDQISKFAVEHDRELSLRGIGITNEENRTIFRIEFEVRNEK
jgi:hypothetical protein